MSASFNGFRGIHDGRSWYRRWCRHQQLMCDHKAWRYWKERHKVEAAAISTVSEKWSWWEIGFLMVFGAACIIGVLR